MPDTHKYNFICDLLNKLNHLEIALTDCLEEGSLKLSGHYGISIPMSRLIQVKGQAEKWKNYIYDRYVNKKSDP